MNKKIKHKKKPSGLERYLTTPILLTLGIAFILTGVIFTVSFDNNNLISNLIKSLTTPSSAEEAIIINSYFSFSKFITFFLPGIALLCLGVYFGLKGVKNRFWVSILGHVYFLLLPVLYYLSFFFGNTQFITPIYAAIYILITYILLIVNSYIHRKSLLFLLAIASFYLALVLMGNMMCLDFSLLFVFVIAFFGIVGFLIVYTKLRNLVIIHSFFGFVYFAFFFLRKFIINSKSEYVIVYLIFTLLFYILMYSFTIYASANSNKPLGKKSQIFLIGSNLLFFMASTSYILFKYYSFSFLWAYVFALLIFNVLCLLFINKYKLSNWLFPHISVIILLASLVLPLLIQQNILFLFILTFSVLMLVYAKINQNKISFWFSLGAFILSLILYFKLWITTYLLSMFGLGILPDYNTLWTGTVNCLVVILSVAIIKKQTKGISLLVNYKWFMPVYKQVLYSVFLIAVTLGLVWAVFSIQYLATASVNLASVSILIAGCIFFIGFISYYSGKSSSHKKPAHYMAFSFVMLFPVLLGWSVTKQHIINFGSLNTNAVLLHYIAIILVVVLGTMSVIRVYKRNSKFPLIQNVVQFITFIYLGFIVCIEYDTLYLIIVNLLNYDQSDFILNAGIVEFNKYLPYTILLWLLSIAEFLFGVFYNKPFLRMCVLYLFLILLIKLFLFDFEMISSRGRSAVFFGLGIFLIGFALVYPKLKAASTRSKKLRYVVKED